MSLDSFFLAGFECSTHRRPDGVRLDLIASTHHDELALDDYLACARLGIRTVRDGLRWHLIERQPGRYDWSSWLPMLEAAEEAGVQVIWDLWHYGAPDFFDLHSPDLAQAFAAFASEAVRLHRAVTGRPALVCPMNEISYFTWAVNSGYFPRARPYERGWFKRHLIGAAIAGVRAIQATDPAVRFIWAEPLIHIAPAGSTPEELEQAEMLRLGQFEACAMLMGLAAPELGGSPDTIDLLGVNFYPDNQWIDGGSTIPLGHFRYRPLSDMLAETFERFGKPILITETGAEGSARVPWLHYVCHEVQEALARTVPVAGVCLYPITSFPGWDNLRDTDVGLFGPLGGDGRRATYAPLADELHRQQRIFERSRS
jgi:hypothetical protein